MRGHRRGVVTGVRAQRLAQPQVAHNRLCLNNVQIISKENVKNMGIKMSK